MAARLGELLNHPVYHADDYYDEHLARRVPGTTLARFQNWTPEAVFLTSSRDMLKDFVAESWDTSPQILDDLAVPDWSNAVVESWALLPDLVQDAAGASDAIFYLLSTETFQRKHYARRRWVKPLLEQTSAPRQAWENWRQRNAAYTNVIRTQAEQHGFFTLTVDGNLSSQEVFDAVKTHLNI